MTIKRDTWVAIGLLVILTLVTIASGIQQSRQQKLPDYYSQSAEPRGALALRTFLNETGYRVLADELEAFQPPREARLIFVLEPDEFKKEELLQLAAWVEKGNTLIAAGTRIGFSEIARDYKFSVRYAEKPLSGLFFQNPILASPTLLEPVDLKTDTFLTTKRADFVTYMGSSSGFAMVSFLHGKGRIILVTGPYLFSNDGLKQAGMPELLSNILTLAGGRGPVWFDEWHHGIRATDTEISGPSEWLMRTSGGRALLFVAGAIFLGLLFQGKLFGRPVPLVREIRRRAPLEYITAIANLGRRAGHRRDVMLQYHAAIKRGLGKRYRLDPFLPDEEYVRFLGKYNPNIDQPALLELLNNLKKPNLSEVAMVKLAAEASEWLKNT